jgi:CHAD domain-containing protein
MDQPAQDSVAPEPLRSVVSKSVGFRLLDFIQTQLHAAQQQLARRGRSRHQGIHEARKCIRRAKAALAIGRPVFGERGIRLNAELGRTCRGLSPLRDAQALIEVLQRLHASSPRPLQDILPMAESAARQRRDLLLAKALVGDPKFKRRCQRLQRLSERLQRLDWNEVAENDVAVAIRHSERRLEKTGKRVARDAEDNELWHTYRRRLRRLRQQANLLSGLGIDIVFLDSAFKAQTNALGEAQDDALLIRLCGSGSPFTPAHRRLLRKSARQRLFIARGHWIPLH